MPTVYQLEGNSETRDRALFRALSGIALKKSIRLAVLSLALAVTVRAQVTPPTPPQPAPEAAQPTAPPTESQTAPAAQAKPEAAPEPQPADGIDSGSYNIHSSIEFGYRSTDISGNPGNYNTFVNLNSGVRLFEQSLEMRSLNE